MESEEVASLFGNGRIRILAGCAPCQPFSTYSQRYDTRSDHKWGLLYEFARLARDLRPDIVTMENVPSVERHEVFEDFVAELRGCDYHVWHDVVECAQYGVPQTRRRMVLLASLHGPIRMIKPTHSKPRDRPAGHRSSPTSRSGRGVRHEIGCTWYRRCHRRIWPVSGLPNREAPGGTGQNISWPTAIETTRGGPIPVSMVVWSGTDQPPR